MGYNDTMHRSQSSEKIFRHNFFHSFAFYLYKIYQRTCWCLFCWWLNDKNVSNFLSFYNGLCCLREEMPLLKYDTNALNFWGLFRHTFDSISLNYTIFGVVETVFNAKISFLLNFIEEFRVWTLILIKFNQEIWLNTSKRS